jgi:hypothetical protein
MNDKKKILLDNAQDRSRTCMRFLPPAPQAGASANSATWASIKDNYRQNKANCQFSFKRFEKQAVLMLLDTFLYTSPSLTG